MVLDVEELVLGVDHGEGVRAIAVHVTVAIRSASIREQDRNLMKRFRGEGPEIPHHGRRPEISGGNTLLGMDKIAELQAISNEENGSVISSHIPVPIFRVELN